MHRIFIGSIAGALTSLALLTPLPASADAPPTVFVRAEGASATLLPQTTVNTTGSQKVLGQTCSGSSALGALDTATAGNWAGSFNKSFGDFFVTAVMGEASTGNNFWSLWVNGRSSSTGGCSTALHPGDHVLWFDCVADANFNCTNNPLSLQAPTVVKRGTKVTATVSQLDGSGHSTPIAGAAVAGSGIAAVSAAGKATFTASRAGVLTIQATKSGATPSDPVFVCVYAVHKSDCASFGTGGPAVHIAGIHEGERFRKPSRTLSGTATASAAGLTDVELSLVRKAPSGRCSYLDPVTGNWHAVACNSKVPTPSISLGASSDWMFLLPSILKPGRYTLEIVASDGAGHTTALKTGTSRLHFTVKK